MKLVWKAGTKTRGAIVALATLCAFFAWPFAFTSAQTQEAKQEVPDNVAPHPAPEQPIPYSHKTHLALGLSCQNCHTNPDPGVLMTFPITSKCMQCHVNVDKDKPPIQKLAEFYKSKQPIPWLRVYQLTPGVNWSHRRHLQAGMQCAMCHGDVSQFDTMAETTAVTSMASCIGCHHANNAPTACKTCHSWPFS
jgi:hypothetical protein